MSALIPTLFSSASRILVLLCLGGVVSAQLSLHLAYKFTDERAGGNGNIGVTQDELTGNSYVLDFSNSMTVHEFDATGKSLGQFATSVCTPPIATPNGVTYDSGTDTLWLVDNSSGGSVLHVD